MGIVHNWLTDTSDPRHFSSRHQYSSARTGAEVWHQCQTVQTLLLFSPIAIIVSTNIHLFYYVYLMEHTDCQAVKLLVFVASASIYWYCLFDFFSF